MSERDDERAGLSEADKDALVEALRAMDRDPCDDLRDRLTAALARAEAAEARVAAVEAVAAQIEADDEESLNTYGQHLAGSVLVCAEMIRAALTTDQPDPEETR